MLIFLLIFLLTGGEIKTVESLKWSGQEFKHGIKTGLIFWLISGPILGGLLVLVFSLHLGQFFGLFDVKFWLFFGGILGMSYTIIQGLKGPEIDAKKVPNQGLKKSAFNALFLGIIIAMVAGILGILWDYLKLTIPFGLTIGLAFGGGYAVIQHFTLRSMLYKKGVAPWNYARFLDYATELIFLQKVGGGYIFIHRMLLEYFAQVETETISESSVKVSQSIDLMNASTVQEISPVNSEEVETSETVKALEPESVSNKICGNCQHENPSDFNFCSKCGTALNSDSISN